MGDRPVVPRGGRGRAAGFSASAPRRVRFGPRTFMIPDGTVYLVEDDEALRSATARLLRACGFSVRTYASAEDFLDALDPSVPGCVLLDLRMPGLSGLELQQTLLHRKIRLPVVFLTGHADVGTVEYAMQQGAIAFLEKPAREDQLVSALNRALDGGGEARHGRYEAAGR